MPWSLALAAALAAGPPDDVLVAWQAPPECPSAEVLRARVRRSQAQLAADRRVRVSVRVEREGPRHYRLELALDVGDGPGERTLVADTCAAAIDTAAWLIALTLEGLAGDPPPGTLAAPIVPPAPPGDATPPAIDGPYAGTSPPAGTSSPASTGPSTSASLPTGTSPHVTSAPPASTGPSTGTASPASTGPFTGTTPPTITTLPDSTTPPASTTAPAITALPAAADPSAIVTSPQRPARPLHLDLWAGGGVGLGLLPAATAVAGGGLALSGRRWQVELGGHYWARRSVALAGAVGGRFAQGHASLRGCAAWERGPVRLSPCGGLALGGLAAAGTGPVVSRAARSLWVGLLLGAQVWLRLHARVRLGLQADAVLVVRRPGFTLAPDDTLLFRPSAVGFSGLLALLVRLR